MTGIAGTHPNVDHAMRTAHHGRGKSVIKESAADKAEDRLDGGRDEAKEKS